MIQSATPTSLEQGRNCWNQTAWSADSKQLWMAWCKHLQR